MNDERTPETILEPERYELHDAPQYHFDLNRRQFFKTLGAGIVVYLLLHDFDVDAQESGAGGRRGGFGQPLPQDIDACP